MSDMKIWLVEEMVHEDEFTDRVELLRELDGWLPAIQRMGAPSTGLIFGSDVQKESVGPIRQNT